MSSPQAQTSHPAGAATPTSLQEAGISRADNGNYILPPILVQYRGGNTQMLMIEVGQPIPPASSITGASLMTVAQMLRNSTGGASSSGNDGSISNNNNNNTSNINNGNGTASNASNQQAVVPAFPLPPSSTSTTTTASAPRGIRGLDYPAFDVSSEGVYNDDSQAVSRFLAPLQRVFERVYGQNENNGTLDGTTGAGNALSDVGLSNRSSSATTTTTTATSPLIDPASSGNLTESATPQDATTPGNGQTPPAESRNIILTINYVYGGSSDSNENNSGSLLLYVPSIDETNEDNVSVLVRLATEIALRTIAVSLRNSAGVSKQTFEALEVRKVKDLKENEQECPICYEKYVDKETEDAESAVSKKRKQGDLEGADENLDADASSSKRAKGNDGNTIPISNADEEFKESKKPSEKVKQPLYTHYPVVMKCGHVFGASCLSEWFKTNSSCPLCRKKIPNVMETASEDSRDVTITLPNLARIISNCRPLIENFNNRLMTFSLSDEEGYNNTNIITDSQDEIPTPNTFLGNSGANILERLSTMRRNQQLDGRPGTADSANNNNTTNDITGGNRVPATTNRQSLVNFIRDIVSSLSRRNGDETPPATNARLGLHSSGRIPIVRPISRSNTQFSGMFPPMGVESRRTANGVETREISMFGDHTTRVATPAPPPPPVSSSVGGATAETSSVSQTEPVPETTESGSGVTENGVENTTDGSGAAS